MFTNQQRARCPSAKHINRKDEGPGSGISSTAHQQLASSPQDHIRDELTTTADNTSLSTSLFVSSETSKTCGGFNIPKSGHNSLSYDFDLEGEGENILSSHNTSGEIEENLDMDQENSFVAEMAVEMKASISPEDIQANESVNYSPSNGDFAEQENKAISQENCASSEDDFVSELTGKLEKSVPLKDIIGDVDDLLSYDISAVNDRESEISTEDSSVAEMASELEDIDGGAEDCFPTSADEDRASRPFPVNCESSENGFVVERATEADDITEEEVEDYLPTGNISVEAGVQALSREKYEPYVDINSEGSNSAKDMSWAGGETTAVSYKNGITTEYNFSAEWAGTGEKQDIVYTPIYATAYTKEDEGDSALQDKPDDDEGSPFSSETEDMYDAEEGDNDETDESMSQDGVSEVDGVHGDDDSDDIHDDEELVYVTNDEDLDIFLGDEESDDFQGGETSGHYPIRQDLDNDVKDLDDDCNDQKTNDILVDNVESNLLAVTMRGNARSESNPSKYNPFYESNPSKYNPPSAEILDAQPSTQILQSRSFLAEDRTDGSESDAAEIENGSSVLDRKDHVSRRGKLPGELNNQVKTDKNKFSQIKNNSSSEYMYSTTEDWLSTVDDGVNNEKSAWEDTMVSYSDLRSDDDFLEYAYRNCAKDGSTLRKDTHVHVTRESNDNLQSSSFLGDTYNTISEDTEDFRNKDCESVLNVETLSGVCSSQAAEQTDKSVLREGAHSKVCLSQAAELTNKSVLRGNICSIRSKVCSSQAAVQTDVLPHVNLDGDFEKAKQYVCDKCGSCYSRVEHLLAHQPEHPIRPQRLGIRCCGCGAGFISYDSLVYHLQLNRMPNLGFRCHCCSHWFPVCDDLFRHKQTKRLRRDSEIERVFLDPTGLFLVRKSY